jgi:hypothetical protein
MDHTWFGLAISTTYCISDKKIIELFSKKYGNKGMVSLVEKGASIRHL